MKPVDNAALCQKLVELATNPEEVVTCDFYESAGKASFHHCAFVDDDNKGMMLQAYAVSSFPNVEYRPYYREDVDISCYINLGLILNKAKDRPAEFIGDRYERFAFYERFQLDSDTILAMDIMFNELIDRATLNDNELAAYNNMAEQDSWKSLNERVLH